MTSCAHPNSPRWMCKSTKVALWTDDRNSVTWGITTVESKTLSLASDRGSLECNTRFSHECWPGNAVKSRASPRNEYSWTALILQHAKRGQGRQALRAYEEMQKDQVKPSPYTFVALLKACSTLLDLESARQVHAEAITKGFGSDLYINTMLVDVYAKCRGLVEARSVFEKMPHKDVASWNAMILGYAQMEKGEESWELFLQMQKQGVIPNGRTYVSVLKACSSLMELDERNKGDKLAARRKYLDTVKGIHSEIIRGKLETNMFVGTMLVDVYAKCGSMGYARHVFDKMPARDVVCWNAMIFGYAVTGRGDEALQLFARMQHEGVLASDRTYVSLLKACSSLAELEEKREGECKPEKQRCLEVVRSIHTDIVKRKFESNEFVGNMLVDVYAKCGSMEDARRVFEAIPRRDVVSWTAMIFCYSHMDKGEEALELFAQMLQEGVAPNDRTYVGALKACSSLVQLAEKDTAGGKAVKERHLETLRVIHTYIVKAGLETDLFVGNMLVDVYVKCGGLEDSRRIFERMPYRNVVTWNTMIIGYAQTDEGEVALQLFARMQQEGVIPDARTYVSVLKAYSILAELEGRNPRVSTGLTKTDLDRVRAIQSEVMTRNSELDLFVGTMLVDVYAKCGFVEDARGVFDRMPHHDIVSWTAMISGYAQMDKGEEGLQLFDRMQQEGVTPDGQTYISALNACGCVAGLEKGKKIHSQILECHLEEVHLCVMGSLIDMYAKCGSMADAQEVFDASPTQDTVSWSVLIAGYAHQGDSEVVFRLFDRMKQEGIQPDGITFLGVLTVCSHVGLVDKGQMYFDAMSKDHGIEATIEHYTCMVDLLGRAGHLAEAMEMVKGLPCQPHSAMWKSVLGSCQKWKDVELGRQAFESAVRLDKQDVAAYVLMSNIYSAAGMGEEAKEIHEMRVEFCGWKQPGHSWWMDMSGVAHVFSVGGRKHRILLHKF